MGESMDIYTKFDLHIHSYASSFLKTGDKEIVANSKIENLSILIERLISNNVNVVAITDHNYFDKDIYEELKKQESQNNCIYKVFPGTEVDLQIERKNVHVICIFDDTNPEHIEKIQNGFEQKEYYSVDEFGSILRKIGLSVVLIAHQKCDYKSEKPQKTSLSCIGQDAFYKFIGCEFFDSLEIQNSKVEGILKNRFEEDGIQNVQLVVGSDCHEWSAYPAHHLGARNSELLYMKSLPTFQGLVMAITDSSRIYKTPEPIKEYALKRILIKNNNKKLSIDLSSKINVIIGDNSVGKSTLIKCLTGNAEKNAIEFLKSHNVEIISQQIDKNLFTYSGQGKIREMFESTEEKLPIRQKFRENFKFIDTSQYTAFIKSIFNYYKLVWDRNEKIVANKQSIIKSLYIPNFSVNEKHYLSIDTNLQTLTNDYSEINKIINEILTSMKTFNNYLSVIEKQDIESLISIKKQLVILLEKYKSKEKDVSFYNEIKNLFIYNATMFNEGITKKSNSDEQSYSSFVNEYNKATKSICNDIELRFSKIDNIWDTFKAFKLVPSINSIGKYCFIDKPTFEDYITKNLITTFISNYIKIDKPLEDLTTSEILTSIRGKRILDKSAENITEFLNILLDSFEKTYFNTTVEIKKGDDKLNESNSAGINALYYLDILSYTFNKSIFIIDQPEDDVSQSRISSDLIPSIKNLSKTAQVILVTHNPQLVVNLDADNVIILKKDEQQINFYWGPLEYKTEEYSILGVCSEKYFDRTNATSDI